MVEVMRTNYIRTATLKGLPRWRIVMRHALRNALMPIVTIAGLQFGNLISGAVLVETVFSWPGLGTLALDAILGRDYPVVQGCLLFTAVVYVAVNLVVDLCYPLFDPRVTAQ